MVSGLKEIKDYEIGEEFFRKNITPLKLNIENGSRVDAKHEAGRLSDSLNMSTLPAIETDRYFIKMGIKDAKSESDASSPMPSSDLFDEFGFFNNNSYNPYIKSASDVFSLPGAG